MDHLFMASKLMFVVLVAATLCLGDDGYVCTRATYYGSPDCYGNPSMYLVIYTFLMLKKTNI